MDSSCGSEVMDLFLRALVNRAVRRYRIWEDSVEGRYWLFQEDEPAEVRFTSSFPGARKILDMDYYQCKVFIQRIKSIQMEMGFYGDDKKDSADRERAGSVDPRSHSGESESKQGRPSGDDKLSRANDNSGGIDGGETGGNGTGANKAAGIPEDSTQEKD